MCKISAPDLTIEEFEKELSIKFFFSYKFPKCLLMAGTQKLEGEISGLSGVCFVLQEIPCCSTFRYVTHVLWPGQLGTDLFAKTLHEMKDKIIGFYHENNLFKL